MKLAKCKSCIRAGTTCEKHLKIRAKHVGQRHRCPQGTQSKGTHHDRHPIAPGRNALWQSMRVLRRFTVSQLAAVSEVQHCAAKKYVLLLKRAGYLRDAAASKPWMGRDGEAVRVLVRDTGVKPPRVRADGTVFDPNLDSPNVGRSGDGAGGGNIAGRLG
jgi:hypothetical protein